MKECVIVTGMHRSGTSICAAAISALGYELGDIGDYKDIENPNGYFENFDIVALNDEILNQYGSSWYSLKGDVCNEISEEKLENFLSRAKSLLERCFEASNKIVIKDPRICVLLPFWKKAFLEIEDLKVSYVLLIRDPVEVSLSQQKRNLHNPAFFKLGKELAYTQLLWFHYYREFTKNLCTEDKVILVNHRNLLSKPSVEIDKLASSLNVIIEGSLRERFLEKIFSKDLYRSVANENINPSSPIYSVYKSLLLSNDQVDINLLRSEFSQVKIGLNEEQITPILVEFSTQLINSTIEQQNILDQNLESLRLENKRLIELLDETRSAYKNLEREFIVANRLLGEERVAHKTTDNALSESQHLVKYYIDINSDLSLALEKTKELLDDERGCHKTTDQALAEAQRVVIDYTKANNELSVALEQTQELLVKERINHKETNKALAEAQTIVSEYTRANNELSLALEHSKTLPKQVK